MKIISIPIVNRLLTLGKHLAWLMGVEGSRYVRKGPTNNPASVVWRVVEICQRS